MSTLFVVLIGLATLMNNPQVENLNPLLKEPIDITVVQPDLQMQIKILVELETVFLILDNKTQEAKTYRDLILAILAGQEETKELLATKKSQLQWDIGNIGRLQTYGVKQEI